MIPRPDPGPVRVLVPSGSGSGPGFGIKIGIGTVPPDPSLEPMKHHPLFQIFKVAFLSIVSIKNFSKNTNINIIMTYHDKPLSFEIL